MFLLRLIFTKLHFVIVFLLYGCAQVVTPTGGERDKQAPELLKVYSYNKNKNNFIVVFEFNEYVSLNKWDESFYISPPISGGVEKKINGKKLIITLKDSLSQQVTYFMYLNNCIKDNNEGNVLGNLNHSFSYSEKKDSLIIDGTLRDSYTKEAIKSSWVMLYNSHVNDSLIFKNKPSYLAKTDINGYFIFPNLNSQRYKLVSLTGPDLKLNQNEKISFMSKTISAVSDSNIILNAFSEHDSNNVQTQFILKSDSLVKSTNSSLKIEMQQNSNYIFQLIRSDTIIKNSYFTEKPYLISNIYSGKYRLRCIFDEDKNNFWTNGSWKKRRQPEKIIYFPENVNIRENWDLELIWDIIE